MTFKVYSYVLVRFSKVVGEMTFCPNVHDFWERDLYKKHFATSLWISLVLSFSYTVTLTLQTFVERLLKVAVSD